MGLLKFLPQRLKLRLILRAVSEGFDQLEAKHIGKLLNEAMDARVEGTLSNAAQKRLAKWLRQVADEVEK